MKRLAATLALCVAAIALPAAEPESILSFDSNITVASHGVLTVTEKIRVWRHDVSADQAGEGNGGGIQKVEQHAPIPIGSVEFA